MYRWSPDGKTIAVHYVDRRGMRRVPFPDYLADETRPNETRRGYPGDPNEIRRVGLVDVTARSLRLLDLDHPERRQIVDFAWSADGALLIDRASDTAVDRWLLVLEPGARKPRTIWHSHREERIYTTFAAVWHPDGRQVIVLSDDEERYGLYRIARDGRQADLPRLSDPAHDVLGAKTLGIGLCQGQQGPVYHG